MDHLAVTVGSKVRLSKSPPYLKTADPMPMLRPADIVTIGEEGTVIDRRPGDYWGVRFNKGMFLLEEDYLEVVR